MSAPHGAALALVGTWLLSYRLFLLRPSWRAWTELATTCCCGLSLGLLAPLLPWPPPLLRAALLALVGGLISLCHPMFTSMVANVSIGSALGGLTWQLGLCRPAAALGVPLLHALVLTLPSLVAVAAFVCTPGVAGPVSLVYVTVPLLGGLLLALGVAALVPAAGALAPGALLAEAPCAAMADGARAPGVLLGGWVVLAVCGSGVQLLLARLRERREAEAAGPGGDLVASLLPGAGGGGGSASLPRPGEGGDRFGILTKAIFADEGADLSHLTENEQKLVEICRKDEEERDRILWGGGLL